MNLLGIGEIIGGVGKIADDLITTDKERLTLALEEKKIEAGLIQSQIEVNKAEAQHASVFVAGWRPFIGWVGGFGMAYQFLLYPLLTWVWPIVLPSAPIPPVLDGDVLFAMVSGLLGIAGMRSFDKMKGTDSKMSRYN